MWAIITPSNEYTFYNFQSKILFRIGSFEDNSSVQRDFRFCFCDFFFFFCCVEGTETYIQIYFSFNLLILPLSIELKHNLMVSANLVWE